MAPRCVCVCVCVEGVFVLAVISGRESVTLSRFCQFVLEGAFWRPSHACRNIWAGPGAAKGTPWQQRSVVRH